MEQVVLKRPTQVERIDEERYKTLTADQLRAIAEGDLSKDEVISKWMAVQPETLTENEINATGFRIEVLVFTHNDSTYIEQDVPAITIGSQTYIEWDTLVSC
jgi:hypothetical protein